LRPRPGRRGRAAAVLLVSAWAAFWLGPGCNNDDGSSEPGASPTPSSGACGAGTPVPGSPALTTTLIARGLQSPLDLQAPPGDHARVFVVEQPGRIRIVRGTTVAPTPFLDISSRVSSGGERGLLGLAFHTRYSETGRFFVNYTDPQGDTRISEFRVSSGNPDQADASSERELMFVRQPFANHNGGGLAFGNDGMLYIGLGDGGSGGDPQGNGQNLGTRLGKLLRIDVDRGAPFAVPADNPFVGRAGALPEIWAYGLRNPWRFAFDRASGDLLIADVGQGAVEEVDLAARRGGDNFGWNVMEGSRCFRPSSGCSSQGLTLPILEYTHSQGCSITGGVVYRGCRLPGYQGTYFYSDYCTAFVRSFRLEGGRVVDERDWSAALGRGLDSVTSFGTDGDGEAYIVDQDGEVYKIVPTG
jgi:glucose/arabinose dehydrogenase